MKKQLLLVVMVTIISSSSKAQQTVYITNADTLVILMKTPELGDMFVTIGARETKCFIFNSFSKETPFTFKSERGAFRSEKLGSPLPKGSYVMTIMWNKKDELYRNFVRELLEEDNFKCDCTPVKKFLLSVR